MVNGKFENINAVIGEIDDDALLCVIDLTACCRCPYAGGNTSGIGKWFFPSRTAVPNKIINAQGLEWGFCRNGGFSVVRMNRRGEVNGIYHCEIPDTTGFNQTIYRHW